MQRLGPVLLTAAAALGACGSGDDVAIADAWARASAPTQTLGAVYFDLTVAEDDTLLAVSVPPSIAAGAEIHEVVMDESTEMTGDADDPGTDIDTDADMDMAGGQMRMHGLEHGLALTGDETVTFEPGGHHVMLIDLAAPLEVGDEFELTLQFAKADDVAATVEVAETAP